MLLKKLIMMKRCYNNIIELILCSLIFIVLVRNTDGLNNKLLERFRWNQVDFEFPDEKSRIAAIDSRQFIQEHNLPLGLEVWRDKLFITLPRWREGIAASLTYVKLKDTNEDKSPKLIPYPNWQAHKLNQKSSNNSHTITSVFRLNVDICDRLWLVDHGVADLFGKYDKKHNPKIQIYNLLNDKLIKEYSFPDSVLKESSFLANIVVDIKDKNSCNEAYAYIPDLGSYSLLVYSLEKDDAWRITHHYFNFDPLAGDYTVGGINFQWSDGIFGVALSPVNKDGYRTLYFHPMSSTREFSVSTKIIQNKTVASDSYHEFKVLGSRGPNTQSSASSVDEKTGILFYTLLNKDAVGCWNSNNEEYSVDTNSIVASDSETMIFPNDLKVDKNSNLWVLTDRLPTMLYSTLNLTDINYRIFFAPVTEVVKGTVCDKIEKIEQIL